MERFGLNGAVAVGGLPGAASIGGGVDPLVLDPFGQTLEPVGERVQLAGTAVIEANVSRDLSERFRDLEIPGRVMGMSRHHKNRC